MNVVMVYVRYELLINVPVAIFFLPTELDNCTYKSTDLMSCFRNQHMISEY